MSVQINAVLHERRHGGQPMPEQKALSTFFMVRSEPGWLIAAAQTTAVNAEVIARLQSRCHHLTISGVFTSARLLTFEGGWVLGTWRFHVPRRIRATAFREQ